MTADATDSESSEDDTEGLDFTVIDINTLKPIPEVSGSLEKSRTLKKRMPQKPENDDNDELDSSFEIVHYHDIHMIKDF